MVSEPKFDPENPEWTEADFARARPARELPPAMLAAFRKGGRPPGSAKQAVSIRLDKDVLEKFRATGPGWQSRTQQGAEAGAGLIPTKWYFAGAPGLAGAGADDGVLVRVDDP